jgi:hypothetical protein
VLAVLVADGAEDGANPDEAAAANDETSHLLGEVVLGRTGEVVPGAVRLRAWWARRNEAGGSGRAGVLSGVVRGGCESWG